MVWMDGWLDWRRTLLRALAGRMLRLMLVNQGMTSTCTLTARKHEPGSQYFRPPPNVG